MEDLDEDMNLYLKTNTFLSRDSNLFWEKLRYALPQKPLTELLKGKETKWKDGWSGLEALAEAQNAAHKKAMRKCQLQNGEKKHCCQYRKPENCHTIEGENQCNNMRNVHDQSTRSGRSDDYSVDWKNDKDRLAGENSDEDTLSIGQCADDIPKCNKGLVRGDIPKNNNVVLNIVDSDCKLGDDSVTDSEITKL